MSVMLLTESKIFNKVSLNLKIKIVVLVLAEAVAQRCSVKKVFLEISQNSQENTCARASFLIKLQVSGMQLY